MKMNKKEAARLKIGDLVQIWAESPDACTGTVIEKNWMAAKIDWDDGQTGVIHLNDMQNVTRHYGVKIVPTPKPIFSGKLDPFNSIVEWANEVTSK
jgi:hypothetical protein